MKKGLAQIRLEDMRLNEIRRALKLSQQTLARRLKTDQAQISRMEQRTDLFVSTVRRYVEALGGQLEIVATFPEATRRDGGLKVPPIVTPISKFRPIEVS